jgi:hypothetical protein
MIHLLLRLNTFRVTRTGAEKKESLRKILMFIRASIILHNILIEFKNEIDQMWEEDNDDDDEEDDSPPVTGDEEMRTSILQHLIDTSVITSQHVLCYKNRRSITMIHLLLRLNTLCVTRTGGG